MSFSKILTLYLGLLVSIVSGQTVVSSFSELIPYLDDDNVRVVMTPGTYRITPDDVSSGLFPSNPSNEDTESTLLAFTGSNSVFDFTGVTFEIDTGVFQSFGNVDVKEIAVWGDDLVLKNLTMVDLGTTRPRRTALGVLLDGSRNRVEGFNMTVRGSYPYGYGDIFGKGSGYVIKHFKHSAILVRGDDNHLLNCSIFHRAYGHGIFCQGSLNARIEGCYLEGEVRTTDEVLAELGTGSGADGVDFETNWALDPVDDPDGPGFILPPGSTFSLQEDGIRAYNTGPGLDGVTRNTRNMEVIDCTVNKMRSGVTIGFCDNTKYVEGCVALGCENGYWVGTEGEIVDSAGTAEFGPLLTNSYQNDRDSVVDLTVLESQVPHTNNIIAYVGGNGHNLTFRNQNSSVNPDLKIMVNGLKEGHRWLAVDPKYNDFSSSDVTLRNLTNYKVILGSKSSDVSGQSGGPVTNNGSGNSVSSTTVNGCGGFAPLRTVEAEDFCSQRGVRVQATAGGGRHVGWVEDGEWIRFDDFHFGVGPNRFEARVAGGTSGGSIEVRLGSVSGSLIGSCNVAGSPVAGNWLVESVDLSAVRGLHDLFLVFKGSGDNLMELDSFTFTHWASDPGNRDAEHLVGDWRFNNGSGLTATDSSGKGNHGTLTAENWVSGFSQTALNFDGDGDKVSIPASSFADIDNEITIAMWIYGDVAQPAPDSVFYAENASNGRVLNIHLPYSDSEVYWDAGNSGGSQRIQSAVSAAQYQGAWNHWAFTKNVTEQTMKVYHNGVLHLAGLGLSNPMAGIAEAVIGGRIGNDSYQGAIDEVKLYNVALTENEVADLLASYAYNAPPVALPANLSVRSDTSLDISLSGSDSESDSLLYTVVDDPSHGVLSGTPPELSYTPTAGFSGSDDFTFRVNDGENNSPLATVSITVWEGRMVAHWALDETGGTMVSDSSGNNHHGTLRSGAWVGGRNGGALNFSGGGTGVTLPSSAFSGISDAITLSMWTFGGANQPQRDSVFYAVDNSGERELNVHLPWENSDVYWDAGNDSGYDRIQNTANPDDYLGQWNHWVFCKDASTGMMTIHLNGERWHSGSGATRLITGITEASLGSQISELGYDGIVDDVMLFDYAMTDAEVAELFVASPFGDWLAGFPSLADKSWEGDPDKDGIVTGLEYVLNGNPGAADAEILPAAIFSGESFVFQFTRRAESANDTIQYFQYSRALGGDWADLRITEPVAAEVSLGPVIGGLQSVTVTVPQSLATDGRLFGRLKVE